MITELKYGKIPAAGYDFLALQCDLCGRVYTDRPANAYTTIKNLSEAGWNFEGHHRGCGCICPDCTNH